VKWLNPYKESNLAAGIVQSLFANCPAGEEDEVQALQNSKQHFGLAHRAEQKLAAGNQTAVTRGIGPRVDR
jgi:hypothetical protein